MKKINLAHWVKYEKVIPDTKNRSLVLSLLGTKLQGIYEELASWPPSLVAEAYIHYSDEPSHKFNAFNVKTQLNLKYEISFIESLRKLLA